MQVQSPLISRKVARQYDQALSLDASRWRHAWQTRSSYHPPIIRFDRPRKTLPISLTGSKCALNCAHCGGVYLKHMQPIWDVHTNGETSLLISGGCDKRGRVPVTNHLEQVIRLREGRRLNWHVGFIDEAELRTIAPYVDVISFDIVGDSETAREVYGLDVSLDDYMETLDLLRRYRPVVPHLTIGLRGGKLSGERAALAALQDKGLDRLIFIVLIPTKGTRYAQCLPPPLSQVTELFLDARVMFPRTRLYLGCMRPYGPYRQYLDQLAVRAGLNAIVNPTRLSQSLATDLGLEIVWEEECCALH